MSSLRSIPTLDLNQFTQGTAAQREAFISELGAAYRDIGFVAVRNHGLSDALTARLYAAIKAFFDLPEPTKQHYEIAGLAGQRGYTGKGKEHAKGRNTGDLKEFYHVGQFLTEADRLERGYPANVFPAEVPDFEATTTAAYQALEAAGRHLLRAIALHLELPESYFDAKIAGGNSILRPIHYFPIPDPDSIPADAVRAAEHEDINLITLLMGASADGLQVLNRDGEWIAITAVPDCVVVNVGDMLQRLTNGVLRSTTHRVVNPPRELMHTSRYSIPFFLHPRSEMDLTALPQCIPAGQQAAYPPITAGAYLTERLREIGLIK
jgi:isopenicillin N synthase-like dioxygenase